MSNYRHTIQVVKTPGILLHDKPWVMLNIWNSARALADIALQFPVNMFHNCSPLQQYIVLNNTKNTLSPGWGKPIVWEHWSAADFNGASQVLVTAGLLIADCFIEIVEYIGE